MCGRFVLNASPEEVAAFFGYLEEAWFPARFNIAPTQPVAVVREAGGKRHFSLMRWGLVPAWVKDPGGFRLLINARRETLTEKPAFSAAIKYRRCLVPASGFYEWRRGPGKAKQPFWLPPKAGELIAFAGLYETWLGADGSEIDTVCIITTDANAEVMGIHDRMPVVITPEDFDIWLSPRELDSEILARLLQPAPDGFFDPVPVSDRVNGADNDDVDLLTPVVEAPPLADLFGDLPPPRAGRSTGRS